MRHSMKNSRRPCPMGRSRISSTRRRRMMESSRRRHILREEEEHDREYFFRWMGDAEKHCGDIVKQAVRSIPDVKVKANDMTYMHVHDKIILTVPVRVSVKVSGENYEPLHAVSDTLSRINSIFDYHKNIGNDQYIKYTDWDGDYEESLRSQNLFHFDIDFVMNTPE